MNWSKVDAALAGALAGEGDRGERRLLVCVHVDALEADPCLLDQLEMRGAASGGVCTGTLSAEGVEQLTDQPWVSRVSLSGPLRLLGED